MKKTLQMVAPDGSELKTQSKVDYSYAVLKQNGEGTWGILSLHRTLKQAEKDTTKIGLPWKTSSDPYYHILDLVIVEVAA